MLGTLAFAMQNFLPSSQHRGGDAAADLPEQVACSGAAAPFLCLRSTTPPTLPSISWWLSFAAGAMVGVWIAFCLSTVTEVHVWDFVEESWIR